MAPSILLFGLSYKDPMIPEHLREQLRTSLDKLDTDMPKTGYNYESLFCGPEGFESAPDSIVSPIVDKLQKMKWDVVVIGFGVRGKPELTLYFEKLVNAIREYAPQAKLGFNSSPGETLDAAKRLAPV
ncbi:uncharacterized protein STEHIDRAFT_172341 [Stereum hirsutum FP-91666 SS1]|uniref:uncharacterized protein n=1 Tax=Stereum hirsutum (strain FP-91666) TaxID=721885 RepID=UPI00044494CB|nr:uncharacterized protein STEHIDRAFT_172341 [Stereum hirsutum FP-91666 SS1]EIM80583.1 hypothetical protein STEHIDRAFT_172341 [Stereum hirsutum FP-91666 SS1]